MRRVVRVSGLSTHTATWLAWSLAGLSVAISGQDRAVRPRPFPAESTSHHVEDGRSDDCSKANRGDSFHGLNIRGGSS